MKRRLATSQNKVIPILVIMALLLCYCTFRSTAWAASFKDVPAGAEYAISVELLSEAGILTGDENGNFNPNNTITRAEFATIVCRLLSVDNEAKGIKQSSFTDVPASHWAVGYIAKANELGIINGNGDGTFSPESPVTQEQAVKMLVCACGYEAEANEAGGYPNGYISTASDLGITKDVAVETGKSAMRKTIAMWCCNVISVPGHGEYDEE